MSQPEIPKPTPNENNKLLKERLLSVLSGFLLLSEITTLCRRLDDKPELLPVFEELATGQLRIAFAEHLSVAARCGQRPLFPSEGIFMAFLLLSEDQKRRVIEISPMSLVVISFSISAFALYETYSLETSRNIWLQLLKNEAYLTFLQQYEAEIYEGITRGWGNISRYLNESQWSERFRNLTRLRRSLGTAGVTDEQVNEVAFQLWAAKNPERYQEFLQYCPDEKRVIINQLRLTLGVDELAHIREWIRQQTEGPTPSERESQLQLLDAREDFNYPLRPLLVSWGYEVEQSLSQPAPVYLNLEVIGFNLGQDNPVEYAPGPFYHPDTGIKSWSEYVDGGFINLYHYYRQTCHFNVGLRNFQQTRYLTRFLHTTMLAYDPVFDSQAGQGVTQKLKIYEKEADDLLYMEIKEYRVMTPEEQTIFFNVAPKLAMAAEAYAKIFQITNCLVDSEIRLASPLLTERAIMDSPASHYQKQLALLWLQLQNDFETVLLVHNASSLVDVLANSQEVREYYSQLKEVFPRLMNRFDETRLLKRTKSGQSFRINGTDYANLVAWARDIALKLTGEVDHLLAEAEGKAVELLADMEAQMSRTEDLSQVHQLFQEYRRLFITGRKPDDTSTLGLGPCMDWWRTYKHLYR